MTSKQRQLCDCYVEGYATGKEKAFFELEMALAGRHPRCRLRCRPCWVKRTVLERGMTSLATSSPALEGNDHRN